MGTNLSKEISQSVQENQFLKMQRYNIFIHKMEELQKAEMRRDAMMDEALLNMESAHMTSRNPLKDILYHYQKACKKGFDSQLVSNTL